MQRSLRDPIEPVAAYDTFAGSLAAFRNPSFLAPLSHQVDPGTGGLVDGLADLTPGTPKPYAPANELTVRPVASPSSAQRPAVQRVWGSFVSSPDVVPMERPDLVDTVEVRHVADAGLTGSGTPEAPVSVARSAAWDGAESLLSVPVTPITASGPVAAQRAAVQRTGEPAALDLPPAADAGPAPEVPLVDAAEPLRPDSDADSDAGSAPLTSAQPMVSRQVVDDWSAPTPPASPVGSDLPVAQGPGAITDSGPSVTGRTRPAPDLPVIQRQLSAVPDRPARRVAAPTSPTLELPVLQRVEPPARSTPLPVPAQPLSVPAQSFPEPAQSFPEPAQSFPEPVEGPASRPTFPEPAPTFPEPAPTFPEPVEGPSRTAETVETVELTVARVAAESEPEPTEPALDPSPDAPLSGFAAAIAALNGPPPASMVSDTDVPMPAPSVAPTPSTPVQRSTVDRHHDPAGPPAALSGTPDLLAGLPTLPVLPIVRPNAAAPTVSRVVGPSSWASPDFAAAPETSTSLEPRALSAGVEVASAGELPRLAQRAAGQPSAALVGARPPLVQRQEANPAILPPAVQPVQFSRPTYPAGPDPVRFAASSQPGAAVSRGEIPTASVTAQRLTAPSPGRAAAAVPLPAAGQPAAPVIPPVITAPVGVGAYGAVEPATETVNLEPPTTPVAVDWSSPSTTPAAVDWSSPPSTPKAEEHASVESTYEVVQLEAAAEHAGPGTASHLTPPAPSVQRSPAAGPVVDPVSMAPPSRLVQRLPAAPAAPAAPAGPVHPSTSRPSGPVSFASMFAGATDAAEDGFTSVQLLGEDAAPVDAPPPSAPLTASSAPAAGAAPAAAAPTDVDELARRLFEPLSARIRAELRLDRERSGLMTDARP